MIKHWLPIAEAVRRYIAAHRLDNYCAECHTMVPHRAGCWVAQFEQAMPGCDAFSCDGRSLEELAAAQGVKPGEPIATADERESDEAIDAFVVLARQRAGEAQESQILDERGAARYISMSTAYLRQARARGNGPAFIKVGRSVRYRRDDLDQFLREHRVAAKG